MESNIEARALGRIRKCELYANLFVNLLEEALDFVLRNQYQSFVGFADRISLNVVAENWSAIDYEVCKRNARGSFPRSSMIEVRSHTELTYMDHCLALNCPSFQKCSSTIALSLSLFGM